MVTGNTPIALTTEPGTLPSAICSNLLRQVYYDSHYTDEERDPEIK